MLFVLSFQNRVNLLWLKRWNQCTYTKGDCWCQILPSHTSICWHPFWWSMATPTLNSVRVDTSWDEGSFVQKRIFLSVGNLDPHWCRNIPSLNQVFMQRRRTMKRGNLPLQLYATRVWCSTVQTLRGCWCGTESKHLPHYCMSDLGAMKNTLHPKFLSQCSALILNECWEIQPHDCILTECFRILRELEPMSDPIYHMIGCHHIFQVVLSKMKHCCQCWPLQKQELTFTSNS